MQKRGLPLRGAACQALVKQTQLGFLTGDFNGNLMLFDFLPAKPTINTPPSGINDSVSSKAPVSYTKGCLITPAHLDYFRLKV